MNGTGGSDSGFGFLLFIQDGGDLQVVLVWGLLATVAMTTILQGSQLLGLSRLSLPFMFGTFLTGDRKWANVLGYGLYLVGGLLFAFFYFAIFATLGHGSWWLGMLFGIVHGLILLTGFLPLLPYVNPRIATEYDGPTAVRRLEPPGPFGLNYGRRTPLTTLAGQAVYGALLGFGYTLL